MQSTRKLPGGVRAAIRPSMPDATRHFGPMGESQARADVGEGLQDADLEQHIRECGQEMQAAYARYEADSEIASLGDAHYWRNAMEQAIRGRSAAQVAQMEAERGLA